MTDQQPLSLDQYRTALAIDRRQAVNLLHQRTQTRRVEALRDAEHRRLLLVELAELRQPRSVVRLEAIRAAAAKAVEILPLLDEARRIEKQWRLEREHFNVWNPAA
jgi:hypothetical protein